MNTPVRKISAKVELYTGSALAQTFNYNDYLKSITIDRVGEQSKFFGFGICQKANFKLIDQSRALHLDTSNSSKIYFSSNSEYTSVFPRFYISEARRDENTNEVSVTAYDALYKAVEHTVSEIELSSYTIQEFAQACAQALGLTLKIENVTDDSFATLYEAGANYEGTEALRDALNDIAEATQTIYFINGAEELVFKRLDAVGAPTLLIDKAEYFTLTSGENRRLSAICHATELGDNVEASLEVSGTTQYVRDNAFWDLREDVGVLVENALTAIGGLTINQFECEWRGDFTAQIGDKIGLTTKDNKIVASYLLDDVISYDGAFVQRTQWHYEADEAETASNPISLGETLKQTYARVDKANKEIEMLVSDVDANTNNISQLFLDTQSISATVTETKEVVAEDLGNINDSISTLTNRVNATMTAEEIEYTISSALDDGVKKVVIDTNFKFDEDGLSISTSDSELHTQITEDGMTIYRNNDEVLVADNVGVNATNLHATTYLIIGNYSRFEDYERNGDKRTGCFWIGD